MVGGRWSVVGGWHSPVIPRTSSSLVPLGRGENVLGQGGIPSVYRSWPTDDRIPDTGYCAFGLDFRSRIKMDVPREKPSIDLTKVAVKDVMKAVADWQVAEPLRHQLGDWTNGALYAGMVEWAKMADDSSYFYYLKEILYRYTKSRSNKL